VTWQLVALAKKWIPIWFAWNIRSHQKTCDYLDTSTETLSCIHDRGHAQGAALNHLIDAGKTFVDKNGHVVQGADDVMVHLDAAQSALDKADQSRIRREEIRRRRKEFERWQLEQNKRTKNGEQPRTADTNYPSEFDDSGEDGETHPRSQPPN